jgi:general secretion pathway protein G
MTSTARRLERSSALAASEGFTLIEILLVVVIIGILAAVVVPKLGGRVGQAQVNAAKSSVSAIRMAVGMYEVDNGKYPDSLQNLISKGNEINWNGPYLEKGEIPKDPWGNEFQYSRQGTQFTVVSAGPDGSFGSEDDIK